MKNIPIRAITILGLIAVFLLQVIWITNAYNIALEDMFRKSGNTFDDAMLASIDMRLHKVDIPDGTFEKYQTITYTSFNQILEELGEPLNIQFIDSVYKKIAHDSNLPTEISIIHFSDSLGTINSSNKDQVWHILCPKKIYTKENQSEYIQVATSNPYKKILNHIGLILVSTIIASILIIYCITYQIKIINRQNRIAQLRSDFSNAMIHDMKSPLTSIISGNRSIQSGKLKEDRINRYHEIINNEAERLLMLSNNILTLAKIEQNKLELNKQIIPIKPLIDDLIEIFSAKAEKEMHFTTNYLIDEVYADPDYLKQIISNLIDNSIKYSGKSVVIEITVTKNDKFSQIKVKDNGFGISLKDQVKIFEKFERGVATKRSSKGGATGFGIGLNYVQQVVAAHKGTVTIDSIEKVFSEFTINLPQLIEEIYD